MLRAREIIRLPVTGICQVLHVNTGYATVRPLATEERTINDGLRDVEVAIKARSPAIRISPRSEVEVLT